MNTLKTTFISLFASFLAVAVVLSGARSMTLSYRELEGYMGQRGARGGLLPRGWQKVEGLLVE